MPRLLFAFVIVAFVALPSMAQPDPETVYRVSEVWIEYANRHDDAPDLAELEAAAPTPEQPGFMSAREIAGMTTLIRDEMAERFGLLGHFVTPDPGQIDPVTGEDLRPSGEDALVILIYVATVGQTRTIGFGERLPVDDSRINHPLHDRVRRVIPLREGDLLRRTPLDLSIARLNRTRGRSAEVAIAPTNEPGAVSLDYLINESKPWTVFAQVANTGTRSTDEIRWLFGARHRQLTNADDVLSISYVTAEFDDANAVSASYRRPLDDLDTTRFTLSFAYNEYTASDVNLGLAAIEGDGLDFGAEFAREVFQRGDAFVDVFGGVLYRDIRVTNLLTDVKGESQLLLARVGVRFDQTTTTTDTRAQASIEVNLPEIADTEEVDLDRLGREDADASFTVLRLDASHGFFLEPLLAPDGYAGLRGPEHQTLAHYVTLSVRTQWVPDARLVANEQVIAGGLFTVRGYEEAVASGDSAILASAEYRFGLSSALPASDRPGTLFGQPFRGRRQTPYGSADWDLGLRAFVDYALVDNNDVRSFEFDENLIGVGVGVDARLYNNVTARLDYGIALTDAQSPTNPSDSGDTRLHFLVLVAY
ncbi:MAG: ShlB/FhaC/HecB family hemolysin secretion/activation protein [Planctomycetota bacterium]